MQTLHRCSFLWVGLVSACFSVVLPPEALEGGHSDAGDAGHAPDEHEPDVRPTALEDAGCGAEAPADAGGDVATPGDAPGEDATLDVLSATVTGPTGAAPLKGDVLTVELHVKSGGTHAGRVRVTVLVDSTRFSDFTGVPLGSADVVGDGETEVTVSGGPFLSDSTQHKEYALGRGDYTLSVRIEREGKKPTLDERIDGAAFTLAASEALFGVVVYDQRYFDEIQGFTGTPREYLDRVYSRPGQVFTPSDPADPDGAGRFQSFPRGFDQMLACASSSASSRASRVKGSLTRAGAKTWAPTPHRCWAWWRAGPAQAPTPAITALILRWVSRRTWAEASTAAGSTYPSAVSSIATQTVRRSCSSTRRGTCSARRTATMWATATAGRSRVT